MDDESDCQVESCWDGAYQNVIFPDVDIFCSGW